MDGLEPFMIVKEMVTNQGNVQNALRYVNNYQGSSIRRIDMINFKLSNQET